MEAAISPALLASLRGSQHTVVVSGSGISAESGVPTFRDAQTGLWSRFRPEELATPEAFERNPGLVWRWYQWRRQLVAAARPNAGHLALVTLETLLKHLTLITQNVDGLHQRAGSSHVIEFHGNIARTVCSAEHCPMEPASDDRREPPHCPHCGAQLRPDVVWFGEPIPVEALRAAQNAAASCDLLMSIGTSAAVYPAAALAKLGLQNGARVIEINPETTPLSERAHYRLPGAAGEVLPRLVWARRSDLQKAPR